MAVTGFTIAHSLTLAAISADLLRINITAVEVLIALSVAFVASEIARAYKRTLSWRYPLLVALAFGLLHGAGFASGLNELGLPQTQKLAALLLFNLGVEVGQISLAFVALAAAHFIDKTLTLHRRINWQRLLAYPVGGIAMFWVFERAQPLLG